MTKANCPSCGGPVEFTRNGSLVVVCAYCHNIVARTDRDVESLGKVAAIVESDSPLRVGLNGRFEGVGFTLTGRTQLRHPAGGGWDEWYAAFDDGRWGWVAEAQGNFYVTFRDESAPKLPPKPSDISPGMTFRLGATTNVVSEVAVAEYAAAEGEIPFRFTPGERYAYVDFTGTDGTFGTIDFSETPPLLFRGRQVALAELGVAAAAAPAREQKVKAVGLNCPHCGGALNLRAPDKTERVVCPNCASLLDVTQGKLQFLYSLEHIEKTQIPLGSVGTFDGKKFTVIGYMKRSVTIDGTKYYWEEYLLYDVASGFRWLTCSDKQWNFVRAVPPGDVQVSTGALYRGTYFKPFQHALAFVEYVLGEFYWKVEVGETVQASDYIAPPQMLSREISESSEASEVNYSLGEYKTPREIEKAFGISGLPRPTNVAPNQPFPWTGIYPLWALFLAIALVLGVFFLVTGSRKQIATKSVGAEQATGAEPTVSDFIGPFTLDSGKNIEIEVRSPVDNSWTYVEGDLYNAATGESQPFAVPVEYYHGYDDGYWTEGSQAAQVYLSSLPQGEYTARFEVQWPNKNEARTVTIQIREGVPRARNLLYLLIALSIIPAFVIFKHASFEAQRWSESSLSPDGSGAPAVTTDDDDSGDDE